MLKDINFERIESIAIAVVSNGPEDDMWTVYLINQGDQDLSHVMVSSKGFGEIDGTMKETATLRWMIGDLPAQSICIIEEIPDDVRSLNNEFLMSFFLNNQLLDKKVVFVSDSIQEQFFIDIPLVNQKGVMIR